MRDMTPQELDTWYRLKRCPCCGAGAIEYERGPRGGASINLTCPRCEMQINVLDPEGPWAVPGMVFGQVLREPRQTAQVVDMLLADLPREHPLRHRLLREIGAECRNHHSTEWRSVKTWAIALSCFNDLGPAWTDNSDFRATKP